MLRTASQLVLLGFWISAPALADCLSLIKGPMVIDVKSCAALNPEKTLTSANEKVGFVKNLPPAEKEKFFNSYRGLFLKALVAKSDAIRSGLSPEKGVLMGEEVEIFIPPGHASCLNIDQKRLQVLMEEACCEGGGEAPCLLPSALQFTKFKVLSEIPKSINQKTASKKARSPEVLTADRHLAKKEYAKAIKIYEVEMKKGSLDLLGHYHLGLSYRLTDQCGQAIPPLEYVHKQSTRKDIWADEEQLIRKGSFLLARCYSKVNDPDRATVILNGYLSDPVKFREELKAGVSHKDFGWIHTSKEYREFKKAADKALRTPPPNK